MAHPITSKRRAKAISTAIFFLGLAIVGFQFPWWPSIMLVIGISLGVKNILLGRMYDAIIALFVFIGVFVTAQYNITWEILLPVVFLLAAIYVLAREFFYRYDETEPEVEEDLNHELEEENEDQ